jgi:RNA polymerase sigma factor (sigma-70 family)
VETNMTADSAQLVVSAVATDEPDLAQLPMEVIERAPTPKQFYCGSELRDILIKSLEQLSPMLRTVFVLRDIEGLSTAQTAEALNLSPTAVKVRLWRVRLQLRECLNEYFRQHPDSARAHSIPSGSHTGRHSSLYAESIISDLLD